MKRWIQSLFILSALAMALPAMADNGGLPDFVTSYIDFDSCTADHHVVHTHMEIRNFSAFDLELPKGLVWATAEENAAAAFDAFQTNLTPLLMKTKDAETLQTQWFDNFLSQAVVIDDVDDNGNPIKEQTSLITKIMLDTKRTLVAAGKYSGMGIHNAASSIVVFPDKACLE
jgi:hypothetical protein